MTLDDSLSDIRKKILPKGRVVRVSVLDERISALRTLVQEQQRDVDWMSKSFGERIPNFKKLGLQKLTPIDKYLSLLGEALERVSEQYYYFSSLRQEEETRVVVPGKDWDAEFYFLDGSNAHFFIAHILSNFPRKYELSSVPYDDK